MQISPKMIYDEINKNVVGQENVKKTVSTAVFLHFLQYCKSVTLPNSPVKKNNILLMGPTGTGKTLITREAAKAVRKITNYNICPLLEVDCTELSARGWVGDDLSQVISDHYRRYSHNESEFNSTIVFLDEFDKLCKPAISKDGYDANRNTQYNLLKIIEGTNIKTGMSSFTTAKMLFVLAGNFSEVRVGRHLNKKKSMGYVDTRKTEYKDIHMELEKAGMVSQLVGRVPFVSELQYLSEEELQAVLDRFIMPEYEDLYDFMGQDFYLPLDKQKEMVYNAYKRKTGARGLYMDVVAHVEDELFNITYSF